MPTYPVSTVPAARAWLFTQLQSALTPDGADGSFELTYANNLDSTSRPDDQVWLGSVTRASKNFAMVGNLGTYALDETYYLSLGIASYRAGDYPDVVDARAWALNSAIEAVVRADPTFGGLLVTSRPEQTTAEDVDWDQDGKGRIAVLRPSIYCYAVI